MEIGTGWHTTESFTAVVDSGSNDYMQAADRCDESAGTFQQDGPTKNADTVERGAAQSVAMPVDLEITTIGSRIDPDISESRPYVECIQGESIAINYEEDSSADEKCFSQVGFPQLCMFAAFTSQLFL